MKDITLDANLIKYLLKGTVDETWNDVEVIRVTKLAEYFEIVDGELLCKSTASTERR